MKIAVALTALLFLTSFAITQAQDTTAQTTSAQTGIDTAILTTDLATVDVSVSAAAAAEAGTPVLVTENGGLNDEIRSQLASLGVKTVIIVGGPLVVTPQAEEELRSLGYTTIRLWGVERTGTAVAVARYFWDKGGSCAVLVDDTKNIDADTRRQWAASNLAAKFDCALVPIPEGTLPAEVISLLKEMGVTDVRFVGRTFGLADELAEFRVRVIEGDDDEIETEIEDHVANATPKTKLKLVVVATPDWKAAVGIGAHPNDESVVRMVSSLDQVPSLVDLINERGITKVKVVGLPELAQQIAAQLNQSNITVTVVSGNKASEIADELVVESRVEWETKRKDELRARTFARVKIKGEIRDALTAFEKELDRIEAELDTTDEDVSELRVRLAEARSVVEEIRNLLAGDSVDDARRTLAKIKYEIREDRYNARFRLKIDIESEIEHEEGGLESRIEKTNELVEKLEQSVRVVKENCRDPEVVEQLLVKVRTLHQAIQQARESGRLGDAAEDLKAVDDLVKTAHSIAERCRESGVLPATAKEVAMREGIEVMEKEGDVMEKESGDVMKREFVIEADDNNFYIDGNAVSSISVKKGERIVIKFAVRTASVSFGGLDFRRGDARTDAAKPGSSVTMDFTAESTTQIISYWPGSNVEKARLDVIVEG